MVLTETTMSNRSGIHLPLEILDSIIDLLRDEPLTLKKYSLVSKS